MTARPALAVALLCTGCLPFVGGGHVTILGESDQSKAEVVAQASALAASIVGRLRELESSLGRWEQCLNKGTCSPRQFLSANESAELQILAAPELAALRDWVEEGYREAESQLANGGAANGAGAHYRPVALHAGERRVQSAPGSGLLASVSRLISRPRELAANDDLITDICVVSSPSEAAFRMWPSSEPERTRETRTSGRIANVNRGSYAFRLTKGTLIYECPGGQRCGKLDLVNDPLPVFNCSLDERVCKRQEKVVKGCLD